MSALVLVNAFARWRRAPDYPIGMPDAICEKLIELYEQHWGQDAAMQSLKRIPGTWRICAVAGAIDA